MGLFTKSKKENDSASAMEEGGNVSGHSMPLSEKSKHEDMTLAIKQEEKLAKEEEKRAKEEEKRIKEEEKRTRKEEEKQEKKLGKQAHVSDDIPMTETKSIKKTFKKEDSGDELKKLPNPLSSGSNPDMQNELPKSDTREKQLLRKIDDVKTIMDDNIQKSLDRGEKMEEIGAQADELEKQSNVFKSDVAKAKKTITWLRWRSYIICGLIIVVILAIALILITLAK